MTHILAVDLGNESGRIVSVTFDGEKLHTQERYRFINQPVTAHGTLYWDALRLWHEIEYGLLHSMNDTPADGIGVASFGVDFGLLDANGALIGNPVHMRDSRTDGILEQVFEIIPEKMLFERTGIGSHPINTLFQLAAIQKQSPWQLDAAKTLLTMPNLMNYWLTGEKRAEFTHSTTTQCYNPTLQEWDKYLLEMLAIPTDIFPEIIQPGEQLGAFQNTPVFAVGSHDTASAVVAVPTQTPYYAYVSSGTWSLFGLEVAHPVTNDLALQSGLTNEGGYGKYRMLSLIMGMWIVQQCRLVWGSDNELLDYDTLFDVADAESFQSFIDPDYAEFFRPGDMPARIRSFCEQTGQPIPQDEKAVIRCVMESLALKYNFVLERQIAAAEQPVDVIYIVGGGAQNSLLCQMTANATGRPVEAGPVEATALGNALVQLIALDEISSLSEARAVVRHSYPPIQYEPTDYDRWAVARDRFALMMYELEG